MSRAISHSSASLAFAASTSPAAQTSPAHGEPATGDAGLQSVPDRAENGMKANRLRGGVSNRAIERSPEGQRYATALSML
jgi:hypothetical protein